MRSWWQSRSRLLKHRPMPRISVMHASEEGDTTRKCMFFDDFDSCPRCPKGLEQQRDTLQAAQIGARQEGVPFYAQTLVDLRISSRHAIQRSADLFSRCTSRHFVFFGGGMHTADSVLLLVMFCVRFWNIFASNIFVRASTGTIRFLDVRRSHIRSDRPSFRVRRRRAGGVSKGAHVVVLSAAALSRKISNVCLDVWIRVLDQCERTWRA